MKLHPYIGKQIAHVYTDRPTILRIDHAEWADRFPSHPEVSVTIRLTDHALCLLYDVQGEDLKGVETLDFGKICTDSCCEFFCRPAGEIAYQNYEVNCIGALTASVRRARKEDVRRRSSDEMGRIERSAPLCKMVADASSPEGELLRQPIPEQAGWHHWQVGLTIPLDLLFPASQLAQSGDLLLEANFYKCADHTAHPHYLCWNPIHLPSPSFHCPEFFGLLVLHH